MNMRLIVALTVLAHLSFAGCRVIISLTAIDHGATPFTVGVVMSLLTVIAMLLAVRWGRWVDRVGARGPMLAGSGAIVAAMALSGATLLVFPVVDGVPLLMALAFLLGVGLGGTQPFVMALLYEKAPAGRGAEVLSVRTWLINFTQTSAPLASGALAAALGMLPVFWAMGATLLVAGSIAARASGSKR